MAVLPFSLVNVFRSLIESAIRLVQIGLMSTAIVLTSVNASIDAQPPSRPNPEVLKPPNGELGMKLYPLTPTAPARSARVTRRARAMSAV